MGVIRRASSSRRGSARAARALSMASPLTASTSARTSWYVLGGQRVPRGIDIDQFGLLGARFKPRSSQDHLGDDDGRGTADGEAAEQAQKPATNDHAVGPPTARDHHDVADLARKTLLQATAWGGARGADRRGESAELAVQLLLVVDVYLAGRKPRCPLLVAQVTNQTAGLSAISCLSWRSSISAPPPAAGRDRLGGGRTLALVTDAMQAAGLPDGEYALGAQRIAVTDGEARDRGRLARRQHADDGPRREGQRRAGGHPAARRPGDGERHPGGAARLPADQGPDRGGRGRGPRRPRRRARGARDDGRGRWAHAAAPLDRVLDEAAARDADRAGARASP